MQEQKGKTPYAGKKLAGTKHMKKKLYEGPKHMKNKAVCRNKVIGENKNV